LRRHGLQRLGEAIERVGDRLRPGGRPEVLDEHVEQPAFDALSEGFRQDFRMPALQKAQVALDSLALVSQ
jgi:hypothetical protein